MNPGGPPIDPQLWRASELMRAGQARPAIDVLRKLLVAQPRLAPAVNTLARAHVMLNEQAQALHHFERATQLAPHVAAFWSDYGSCLIGVGKPEAAVAALRRAVELDGGIANAWAGLSTALAMLKRYDESIDAGLRCIQAAPNIPHGYQNTAMSMIESGRSEEALRVAHQGHHHVPEFHPTLSTILQATHYVEHEPANLVAWHRRFGQLYRGVPLPPAVTPLDPERMLRVGVMSSDFRTHSVAHFAEPLIAGRDRARVALALYSTGRFTPDAVTERFRSMADGFVDVSGMDDAALDRQIRADGIDVLIELNGHTANNRVTALLSKPAPIIISAIGYPNTTGIPAVDLRLVDSITDPPGTESLLTERPLRIDPCFLCYRPREDAPPVSPLPDGPPVFASFNAMAKISKTTCELWSRTLAAAPGSRLLIKCATGLDQPAVAKRLLDRLVAAGIAADRVELVAARESLVHHLRLYSRGWIGLDPSPYNGTTTTCEALWMGVPVVTLEGASHVSRVSSSLLRAAGLGECVARTPEQYAAIAAGLAADRGRLESLRASLRSRVAASALCDASTYGVKFWEAVRQAWRSHCVPRP